MRGSVPPSGVGRSPIVLLALTLACGAAGAQIYASAPAGDAGTVVLSNHPSQDTPLLLIGAPADVPDAGPPAPRPGGAPKALAELIEAVAAEVRVSPQLLHAVIAVESNFDPRAVSRKGAMGLMQLMPATARRFGARDPWSPADNVRAGALYLKWLSERFDGNLELVLAAYNAGEQAVLRAGRRVPDIAETRAYVPRVLSRLRCAGASTCVAA